MEEQHHEHHKKEGNEGMYAVAIAMIVSVIILSGVMVYAVNGVNSNLAQINTNLGNLKININSNVPTGQQLQGTPTPAPTQAPAQQPNAPTFKLEGAPTKGKADAPITIVEYSDFQCPYCQKFYSQTYPSILTDWVESGKAKFVFKHFPLTQIHPNAQKASEATECAKDQNKFWEFHDKIFENQGAIAITDLKKYAADLKLNTATFDKCLDGGEKAAQVNADLQEGIANGVTGTPSFFVNGQNIVGAQPYTVFQQVLGSAA
ncbi:MAG: DsbA family protein [Candidatus Micrarchaeota archaeon]